MRKVKLEYFKSTSGKYYSSGEYEVPSTLQMFEIFEDVRRLAKARALPGLVAGAYGYIVRVECPTHPHDYPGLVLPELSPLDNPERLG